tara:strand:- start:9142 stop:10002 length:861 start_codon:yes stop_codon:yes gene_type:complete
MSKVEFTKYEGLGNDFILVNGHNNQLPNELRSGEPSLVKSLCNRKFGIGADGVILLLKSKGDGDVRMRIFNSDGSEAEMCGNGIRCLIKFIIDSNINISDLKYNVETKAGLILATLEKDNLIRVNMGKPIFEALKIPTLLEDKTQGVPSGSINIQNHLFNVYSVSMGNPHLVLYSSDISSLEFELLGKELEVHKSFPSRTNVHFVQIIDKSNIKVLTWERGCGPTLACGTGACGVMAITHKLGLCNDNVLVSLKGGDLSISWQSNDQPIYMKGPANKVYSGYIDIS